MTNRQEPPIEIYNEFFCLECGNVHPIEVCPNCGSFIEFGYGLMGGNCSSYSVCSSMCGWIYKDNEEK